VRAAAGFYAQDAIRWQRIVLEQEIGVFAGIDIVGDDGDIVVVSQRGTELFEQSGFT